MTAAMYIDLLLMWLEIFLGTEAGPFPLSPECQMVVDLLNRAGGSRELSRMTGIDRRLLQRQAKGQPPQPHHIEALERAEAAITRAHAETLAQAFRRLAA